ncbi:hypothetical protein VPH35_003551 [Triticum aestivum]
MPPKLVRQLGEMEELVEEILIRLPPDDPGNLLRASLACKPWRRLLASCGFRRRYRDFHRTPPMLGFLHSWLCTEFVPTTDFRPCEPDLLHSRYSMEDCRHGRVLLQYFDRDANIPLLVIWEPVTGSQTVLRCPEMPGTSSSASVLCAADGCRHDDCHLGPSLVVFVSLDEEARVATASVYSSETGNWSSPVTLDVGFVEIEISFTTMPSVLVGDVLYFPISRDHSNGTLMYDLAGYCLSDIHLPCSFIYFRCPIAPILMASDDGRLGLAELYNFDLTIWWREVDPDGLASWTRRSRINLETILPVGDPEVTTELVGSIEGTVIVFAITDLGTYMIDLKSLSLKELSNELCQQEGITWALYPYLSFYSPPGTGVVAEASSEAGHGDDEA